MQLLYKNYTTHDSKSSFVSFIFNCNFINLTQDKNKMDLEVLQFVFGDFLPFLYQQIILFRQLTIAMNSIVIMFISIERLIMIQSMLDID